LEISDEGEGSQNPNTSLEPLLSVTKTNPSFHHQKCLQSGLERSHVKMTARPSAPRDSRGCLGASQFEDDERYTVLAKHLIKSCGLCGHCRQQQTKCPTLAEFGARQLDSKYAKARSDLAAKLVLSSSSMTSYQGNQLMFLIEEFE
jgi:hypothetical protein